MKHLTIPLLLAGSLIALSTMEAGAVACVAYAAEATAGPVAIKVRRS